jgi:hypothetical protein
MTKNNSKNLKDQKEIKDLINSVVSGLESIKKPVERELKRLNKIIQEEQNKTDNYSIVVDYKKWIKHYRPDLLKDKKIMSALDVFELLGAYESRKKKLLRKKTVKQYLVYLTYEELSKIKEMVEEYIVGWSTSLFEINMGKSILKEFEYKYGDNETWFSSKELSLILKGIMIGITEILDDYTRKPGEYYSEEDIKEYLLFVKSMIEKRIKVTSRTYWLEIRDDGTGKTKRNIVRKEVGLLEEFTKTSKLKKLVGSEL